MEGHSNFESKSSEAMQQPRGAEQWVGESSQPTHTGPNEFAMRADVSTNVNVGGTGQSTPGQPQPVLQQHYQPTPQQHYQPTPQQHYQPPPQYTPNTTSRPQIAEFSVPHDASRIENPKPFPAQQQYPVHTTQPGAYPAMYQPQMQPGIQQNTYIGCGAVQTPPALYVPDEMGFSIFTTFCCCLCLGITAMIFSSQANGLRHVDPQGALSKAKTARALNITAVVIGIILIAVSVALNYTVYNYNYRYN